MSRKWLIGLLLISWTLNVAFGVAYYLKSHYPTGGYWMSESLRPHFAPQHNEHFTLAKKEFREKIEPTLKHRRHLLREMAQLFMEDEIDSLKLNRLSDSLDIINSDFQRNQLLHLQDMHGRIPAGERHKMAKRLMRRFDGPHNLHDPQQRRDRRRGRIKQ